MHCTAETTFFDLQVDVQRHLNSPRKDQRLLQQPQHNEVFSKNPAELLLSLLNNVEDGDEVEILAIYKNTEDFVSVSESEDAVDELATTVERHESLPPAVSRNMTRRPPTAERRAKKAENRKLKKAAKRLRDAASDS